MWAKFPVFRRTRPTTAIIEIYLNLGLIGLLLFVGVLIAFYGTMREKLERAIAEVSVNPTELALAKFGIGYLAAYLLYNVTEAIFQPLNFLFIVFLVLGMRYAMGRTRRPAPAHRAWTGVCHAPLSSARNGTSNVRQWHPRNRSSDATDRPRGPSRSVRGSMREALRAPKWRPPGSRQKGAGHREGAGSGLRRLKRWKRG